MRRLIVHFSEPGASARSVLGLPLALRHAVVGQRAGADEVVFLVPPGEVETALRVLEDPRRKGAVRVLDHPGPPAPLPSVVREGAETLWVVAGETVVSERALRALAPGVRLLGGEGPPPAAFAAVSVPEVALAALHGLGEERPVPVGRGAPWAPVGDAAERMLIESLTKDADGVVSRNINRKISGAITRRLAPLPVHPNAVTGVVALLGLAAGPVAALGGYGPHLLAGLLYYVSAIIDGVDGEISRLKHLGSSLGMWLDTLTDDAVCTAYLIGLYWALHAEHGGHWSWIGPATIGCFLATIGPRYWLMLTRFGGGDHQQITANARAAPKGRLGRAADLLAATFFRTDFLPFFAFVCALAGAPWFFGYAFAVGSVAAAVETAITVRRALRRG